MNHHPLRTLCAVVVTVFCTAAAVAQQDLAYVPPKGGYDTPGSFIKPLDGVGETYERVLGAPLSNVYQRQVRLKMIGLENLSRLTTLQESIKQGDDAERQRVQAQQAKSPGSTGGQLGAILGKLNPLMAKEVDRQKEVVKDDMVVRLVEAGSPADTPGAAIVDVVGAPNQVTGSIFGAKINNKVRVAVATDDFNPRILIVRHRPKGSFSALQGDPDPEFSVVASAEIELQGANKIFATFDRSTKSADGARAGLFIVVTSDDGKAVSGKYTIKYYPQ